jgi:hypothetical protein
MERVPATDDSPGTRMDAGTDTEADGRWLSYAELADARRIDKQSAIRLTRRHQWQRQKDNHGIVRTYVPEEWAGVPSEQAAGSMDTYSEMSVAMAFKPMEAAIAALREQLEHERTRADRAEQSRETERYRVEALRDRIEALQAQVAVAEAAAEAAEAEAAELRAAHQPARQTVGLLAMLRAAWRGE